MTVQPSSADREQLRQMLANAIDSPTVGALADVFGRNAKLNKSYSEQIVDILLPRFVGVAQARVGPEAMAWATEEAVAIEQYKAANPDWENHTRPAREVTQPTQGAPKTIMEAAASAADKISLWSNSKQGYANRIVPQPTQGGDKGDLERKVADLIKEHVTVGYSFKDGYIDHDTIGVMGTIAAAHVVLHFLGNAYSSRTWDIALSERVMQFETAGVYKLSCKQILGLIAFIRDGEGSVVTSTSRAAPTGPWAEGCPNYPGCKCDDVCIDWGGSPLPSTQEKSP